MTDKDLKNIKFLKLEIKRTDRALCQIATESKSGAEYRELLTQTVDQVAKVANRLLQRKGEIQNREKYIQCMLAECFGIGENE